MLLRKENTGEIITMKRFAFLGGFVLLSTAIALPLFLMRKKRVLSEDNEENLRYDINEYMAAEGL
jgi:hypothetical protein